MVLNIQTYRSCLTVQTRIRLKSEKQSDCGLHSLHFQSVGNVINGPKYSNIQVLSDSADPDRAAIRGAV